MKRISSLAIAPKPKTQSSSECDECLNLLTDPHGRIPIAADWPSIFNFLGQIGSYYLQTRHAYGRLIVKKPFCKVDWLEEGVLAADKEGELLLYPKAQYSVSGRVAHCECCGSPGSIDFTNEHGLDMMQICCPADVKAIQWGKFIAKCSSTSPKFPPVKRKERIPIIPGNAQPLDTEASAVTTLLDWIVKNEASFIATLVSTGVIHRQEIKPIYVDWNENVLHATDREVTLQLGLAAVRSIFVSNIHDSPRFFIAGPDNVQLLAIEPPEKEEDREAYIEVVSPFLPDSK